jgi:enoyl-CoA hydratase
MHATKITCFVEGGVGTLLLVPPEGKPVTLDGDVLDAMESAIVQLSADENLRIVFVRSSSERFFCVGANINVLKETDASTIGPWVLKGHSVLNQLEDLPVPVVAVIEGYAMGGGLELAMACDLIFAINTAKLAQSEAGLGFIPGWGGTYRLARRIGVSKAKYYYYSGKMIDPATAFSIGLVDFTGSADALAEEVEKFTRAVISNNQNALKQFKKIVNEQMRAERDAHAQIEAIHSVSCLQDPDAKQRLNYFLTKKSKQSL